MSRDAFHVLESFVQEQDKMAEEVDEATPSSSFCVLLLVTFSHTHSACHKAKVASNVHVACIPAFLRLKCVQNFSSEMASFLKAEMCSDFHSLIAVLGLVSEMSIML